MLKLHYFKIEIRNRAGGGETICPRRRQFDPKNAADLRPSENAVATPGFCNREGSEVRVYRGSRVRSPPEADTFTAVHREFVGFGKV